MTSPLKNALPALAFFLCTLIWGSTWLAIKIGYEDLPPLNGAALRFLIAAVILCILQIITRTPMPKGAREWGVVVFVGIVLVGLDYGLIYWAEQRLTSGLTSLLFATMPLFTLLLARALHLETLTLRKTVGIAAAIAGVAVLSSESLQLDPGALLPAGAVLGGACCSAATTTVTKKYGNKIHPITLNGWSSVVGVFVLYSAALAFGENIKFPATRQGWFAVVYLAICGSVLAFLLYFWLLRRWDATRCGMVSVLTPLLAVLLGAILRNEPVTITLLAGAILVLAGVTVAMRPTTKSR